MKVKVFILNAFVKNKLGGNSAGVILHAEHLSNLDRKKVSKKLGFSETAFVEPSNKASYKATFFTPTEEIDVCGHAIIATYSLLFNKKIISLGLHTLELKNSILDVQINEEGIVFMDQILPIFSEPIDLHIITNILNINEDKILSSHLPPQIVSTGLRDIIVPIIDRKTLYGLKPDFEKMATLNQETKTIGFHLFTLDIIYETSIAHSRNFAPLYGILEESATGSASGALACYLFHNKRLKNRNITRLLFEQGYSMNKPSEIEVSLNADHDELTKVQVGGKAILIDEKEIEI